MRDGERKYSCVSCTRNSVANGSYRRDFPVIKTWENPCIVRLNGARTKSGAFRVSDNNGSGLVYSQEWTVLLG